ncbi:hypothetical protein C3L57_08905, partial [Veillonellaceae bacterium M2-8]|nr:hypothetical protein [Veillonellaceae bacterium M2-8]
MLRQREGDVGFTTGFRFCPYAPRSRRGDLRDVVLGETTARVVVDEASVALVEAVRVGDVHAILRLEPDADGRFEGVDLRYGLRGEAGSVVLAVDCDRAGLGIDSCLGLVGRVQHLCIIAVNGDRARGRVHHD